MNDTADVQIPDETLRHFDTALRDAYIDTHEIEMTVHDDALILRGHVASQDLRRRATEVLEPIIGALDLQNELLVAPVGRETSQ